jgi:hypothetical protein
MFNNIIVLGTTVVVLLCLFSKRVRASSEWRATATPLASIIGSGFLVSAPLLILSTGQYAPFAMMVIAFIAYALGSCIRYNIKHAEPLLNKKIPRHKKVLFFESLSRIGLALAYFISIAFYLKLLSAFALQGFGVSSSLGEKLLTTLLLLFIGIVGKMQGLSFLESLETCSVNTKLAIIVALIIGHTVFNFGLLFNGQWMLTVYPHEGLYITIRKLLGLLVIIQGFETSRYLGSAYSPETRILTMKKAQIISGIIYVLFIATTLTAFNNVHELGETTVIGVCRTIAPVLPFMLIIAAVMSQFSAAIADTIGGGGLIAEATYKKISINTSYIFIAFVGIVLTWLTNIYTIIAIASKAFAVYYALQLLITICLINKSSIKGFGLLMLYASLFALMLLVVFFGVPIK